MTVSLSTCILSSRCCPMKGSQTNLQEELINCSKENCFSLIAVAQWGNRYLLTDVALPRSPLHTRSYEIFPVKSWDALLQQSQLLHCVQDRSPQHGKLSGVKLGRQGQPIFHREAEISRCFLWCYHRLHFQAGDRCTFRPNFGLDH